MILSRGLLDPWPCLLLVHGDTEAPAVHHADLMLAPSVTRLGSGLVRRQLGVMYFEGKGVAPSWRRARELYERAIELGNAQAVKNMQTLTQSIANVTSSGKPPHTTPTPIA